MITQKQALILDYLKKGYWISVVIDNHDPTDVQRELTNGEDTEFTVHAATIKGMLKKGLIHEVQCPQQTVHLHFEKYVAA